MDTPKYINTVEWFFGYGGNHLGLKRVLPNLRLIAACEIEAYAVANITEKMEQGRLDSAPVWTDCKTFPTEPFKGGVVDLFIASYPCQPFSAAGKRKGKEDPRHLWPYVREFIRETQPKMCFFENVEGHVSLGLREVLTDLANLGYRVESDSGESAWGLFSAAEVGAPHQRKRVFILAHSKCGGREELADNTMWGCEWGGPDQVGSRGEMANGITGSGEPQSFRWPARPGEPQYDWEEPRVVADSKLPRRPLDWLNVGMGRQWELSEGWEEPHGKAKPELGRKSSRPASGVDPNRNRVDRLRLLGNGVVPATAEKAFRVLYDRIINSGSYVQPSIQLELFA